METCFLPFYAGRNEREKKKSIKLLHRLPRFIITLGSNLFLSPLVCFITGPRWYDHRCCCWCRRRRATRPLVWSTFFTVHCLAFPFQSKTLMVLVQTGYWLTIDPSGLPECKKLTFSVQMRFFPSDFFLVARNGNKTRMKPCWEVVASLFCDELNSSTWVKNYLIIHDHDDRSSRLLRKLPH